MPSDQVLITLIQTIGGVVLAYIGYKKIRADQEHTRSKIQENTDKTEQIGVAVNGRVDALVKEKVDAIEDTYKAKVAALESQVEALQTALSAATSH